jgi:hypothetical protein
MAVTQRLKVFADALESTRKVVCNVLEVHQGRAHLSHDAGYRWPHVPRVVGSESASGDAVGLAGIAPDQKICTASERSAVERAKVGPNRRGIQVVRRHPSDQSRCDRDFDLHVAEAASSWKHVSDGGVESAVA